MLVWLHDLGHSGRIKFEEGKGVWRAVARHLGLSHRQAERLREAGALTAEAYRDFCNALRCEGGPDEEASRCLWELKLKRAIARLSLASCLLTEAGADAPWYPKVREWLWYDMPVDWRITEGVTPDIRSRAEEFRQAAKEYNALMKNAW